MAAAVGNLSKITPDQKCFARSPASSRARKITHVAPKFNKRLYKCANLVRAKAVSGGLNSAPVPNLREVKASASSTMDFTDGSKSNLDMPEILSTQQDKPRPAFHLHFGAGRLGMGLVFPAIVAGKVPFAIMQPPFEEFNPILAERPERVGVTINGKAAMEGGLRVVYDEDVRAEECALPGSGSLVLTDAASAQWVLMAKAATSFTCSVGPALPKILGPLLSQLPELPEELQPVLYACENDHKAVEQLKELVAGKVSVVPCMVDRICSSRSIEASSIVVNTEPWRGNIIPQAPMAELSKPAVGEGAVPLAGSSVFVPRTMEVADYRYQRKIYFVNHMHTTLALMTLVRHRQANNRSVEEMLDYDGACVPLKLLNPETVPEMQKLELKAWMVAQILMLVHEFTVPLMMDAHQLPTEDALCKNLVELAQDRLRRFSTIEDTCDRVLGAGVACRFEGRLLPAYEAVKEMRAHSEQWHKDSPEAKILHYAGMSIHDVYWSLTRMVEEGRELADADMVKRYGPTSEAQDEARVNWIAKQLHGYHLDWLCCAMGIATQEELNSIDQMSMDNAS